MVAVELSERHANMTNRHLSAVVSGWDSKREGEKLFELIAALYPICRSITGNGLRSSLRLLQDYVPLALHEVPSGTQVFDWVVPNEWNISDAYIMTTRGVKVVDFHDSNLHVVNYSRPVREKVALAVLRDHLFSLPESPDWIPYRTSYYNQTWGFCVSHRLFQSLTDEEYEVCIDSTLAPGHLTYGEFRIQGATDDEVLISAHSCHPSLCNDNLSGMAVAAGLAKLISGAQLRYSYRFLWIPATIGSIAWLALNERLSAKIKHGLVLSCVGDPGAFTYKRSRHGNAEIDKAVEEVLKWSGQEFRVVDFAPIGYDERQYCSPGINLPVGCLMRTPNGEFPQYHTSADDLSLVKSTSLGESLLQMVQIVSTLEENWRYVNLNPKCEPQLGRRGLYRSIGGMKTPAVEEAVLWVLNMSDGMHSLLDIAARSGLPFGALSLAAGHLEGVGLLEKQDGNRK